MPELPEVETVRRNLHDSVLKKEIDSVLISGARTVRRHGAQLIADALSGSFFVDTRRQGKFLGLDLESGMTLGIHLRMSGQLRVQAHIDPVAKHTHCRIRFADDSELRFIDPRTFGELWLQDVDDPLSDKLGPDAYAELLSADDFRARISRRRVPIKTLLLDQSVVSGLGNIYTDEVLWLAKVPSTALPSEISRQGYQRIVEAIKTVLGRAVKTGGSTLADAQYVDVFGNVGSAQMHHEVYARQGQPCSRCGTEITRVVISGRSTFFCPRCQQ